VFAQSFTSADSTLEIQLAAVIDNLLPTVTLSGSPTFECNTPGGANVAIDATMADADGSVTSSQWYVDGHIVAVNTPTLHAFLPLGPHTIHVDVFDSDGGPGSADTTVEVADTTPPVLSIDSFCLWPPNHDLYVIDPSMVTITDACDPNPTLAFIGGTSNQADNGTGDGNTTGDLVVHSDAVCARAERDGKVLDGRVYTIAARVADAAGNQSDVSFVIDVPHDHSTMCDGNGGIAVDAGDPRCIPPDPPLAATSAEPSDRDDFAVAAPQGGGCEVAGGSPSSVLLIVACYSILRRRRRDS
jgi:hypothetical protein